MSNVFIYHRQEDIAYIAVRIKDRLAKRFGEAHAFLATGPLARSHPVAIDLRCDSAVATRMHAPIFPVLATYL
jgi:hypothetical protein